LNRNLFISATCEAIVAKTKKLADEYNERINKNRKTKPTLIDKTAFQVVKSLLTHYAINKAMVEWRAIKDFSDAIDNSDEEIFEFDEVVGCLCKYKLPLRFSLPYKY
jgi:phosphatidylglycerophosphatase A